MTRLADDQREQTGAKPDVRPIVAREVWLETHFQYECPSCGALNEVSSIGATAYTQARCASCHAVVQVRQPLPAQTV